MPLKMSSTKWRQFCLALNALIDDVMNAVVINNNNHRQNRWFTMHVYTKFDYDILIHFNPWAIRQKGCCRHLRLSVRTHHPC